MLRRVERSGSTGEATEGGWVWPLPVICPSVPAQHYPDPGNGAALQPTFRTPRVTLRPRAMADLEACLTMDRDPAVSRFIDGPWSDPQRHRAFVEQRIRHTYPDGMGYWSILADTFVGWILLAPLDLTGPEIEIGWRITKAARGKGYATEAALCVLKHALETLQVSRVVADIDPGNAASLAVAGKLGLRPTHQVPYAGRLVMRYVARRDEPPLQ